jgi:hypothetical protein
MVRPKQLKKRQSYEQKIDKPVAITPIEYGGLQEAFDHFNAALFNGVLPDVFITYQRKAHSNGYFSACGQNVWGKPDTAVTCTPCGIDMSAEGANANGAADTQPAQPRRYP